MTQLMELHLVQGSRSDVAAVLNLLIAATSDDVPLGQRMPIA